MVDLAMRIIRILPFFFAVVVAAVDRPQKEFPLWSGKAPGQKGDTSRDIPTLTAYWSTKPSGAANNGELLTVKIRYKQPDGDTSKLLEFPIKDTGKRFGQADQDFRFAAAVAQFGMLLRGSEHKGDSNYAAVLEIATEAAAGDKSGYRQEFLELVRMASQLSDR